MARSSAGRRDQHTFSQVPTAQIQRSVFDRSCGVKTAFDGGYLIPVFVDEALPGDTFSMNMTLFSRIATLIYPIMDNVYLDVFFFFVPNRLLWDNWEKFMGAQDNPGDSTTFVCPTLTAHPTNGFLENSLEDYLGFPVHRGGIEVNAFANRAYNLIYKEWFRDQNLIDSPVINTDDGPDSTADYALLRRGKRHDYFTSCLPWPQKGTAESVPIGTSAPLSGIANVAGAGVPTFDGTTSGTSNLAGSGAAATTWSPASLSGNAQWNTPNLTVDLSQGTADLGSATAATINTLRQSFQIQKLLERDARGGTRYVELLKSHFGVTSPDFRLQRPEYLGGGSAPIMQTPVPVTSNAASGTPGDLSSFGVATGTGIGFNKSFVEHGIVLGLVAARADINYQHGLHRMHSRSSRYDYYFPAFAHLGEQAVLTQELYMDGSATDDDVFGYQERWAELRYKPSLITSQMRSISEVSGSGTLDPWHLAQDFTSAPVLNEEFIEEDPPYDRVIAVPTQPHFILDAHFKFRCARPLPTFSVPGMIDHF